MEMHVYCQRQICSPRSVLSGVIRLMAVFVGVCCWGGVKSECGRRKCEFSPLIAISSVWSSPPDLHISEINTALRGFLATAWLLFVFCLSLWYMDLLGLIPIKWINMCAQYLLFSVACCRYVTSGWRSGHEGLQIRQPLDSELEQSLTWRQKCSYIRCSRELSNMTCTVLAFFCGNCCLEREHLKMVKDTCCLFGASFYYNCVAVESCGHLDIGQRKLCDWKGTERIVQCPQWVRFTTAENPLFGCKMVFIWFIEIKKVYSATICRKIGKVRALNLNGKDYGCTRLDYFKSSRS